MQVLKPWTNITVKKTENAFSVDVWGRTYTFENSVFPTSIITQGQELLAAPIALKMDFGFGDQEPYCCKNEILEAEKDKVLIVGAALCGNLIINTAVTIEYDGFVKLNVKLVPPGPYNYIKDWKDEWSTDTKVRLQSARLEMALNKENASLMHFWPASNGSVVQNVVVGSGKFRDAALPFKPSVWVGNEKCGLNLCMETDENIYLDDPNACVCTTAAENRHMLSVRLLDQVPAQWAKKEESWAHTLPPVAYDFLLEATPVKPVTRELEDDWRIFRTSVSGEELEEAAAKGAKWIHLHEEWGMMQNYGIPANREQFLNTVEKAHSLGLKVMPYFGYEYSSARPDFEKNMHDYLNKTTDGDFTGGWTRQGLYQKAYIVCYKGGYSREMLNAAAGAMDNLGVDGIYTDGTYIPWECANEDHGCGYRDAEGNLHPTYPILAVREHVKKLYEEVHARGGRVDAHQSGCCVIPVLAFCDSYWDGENLQGAMKQGMEGILDLDAFRCEFYGKNFGLPAQLIAYLNPPQYTMRNVLALSMLHDVLPRPLHMEELDYITKVWNAYDSFGVATAAWHPYWEKTAAVTCGNPNVVISAYDKAEGSLVFVAKFGEAAGEVTLQLPEGFTKAVELFDGNTYTAVDGKIRCEMEPFTIYMFRI